MRPGRSGPDVAAGAAPPHRRCHRLFRPRHPKKSVPWAPRGGPKNTYVNGHRRKSSATELTSRARDVSQREKIFRLAGTPGLAILFRVGRNVFVPQLLRKGCELWLKERPLLRHGNHGGESPRRKPANPAGWPVAGPVLCSPIRFGALPIIDHFLGRMKLEHILVENLPPDDPRANPGRPGVADAGLQRAAVARTDLWRRRMGVGLGSRPVEPLARRSSPAAG